jgi:DNA-binding CsgD family transcriptional regulator/PAS domain-containing protein
MILFPIPVKSGIGWGAAADCMETRAPKDEAGRLSGLIGAIYDCVIDPARWDETLDDVRELLDCANCSLAVLDRRTNRVRVQKVINIAPEWVAKTADYAGDLANLYYTVPDFWTRPLDEPFCPSRDADPKAFLENRYRLEWALPQGLVDAVALLLMRDTERLAEVGFGRHRSVGLVTEREVRLLHHLAPHLRRAITISDLIDMKSLTADALGKTLDALAIGIVLVADDGAIVHANRPAERMLAEGWPIRSSGGRLTTGAPETSERLHRVVAMATRGEAEIGGAGIGMALASPEQGAAIAHVLPLARGDLRTGLVPHAMAAVFISSGAGRPAGELQGLADAFGMSPAETRVLGRLILGESIDAAARALGVARPTVKTHLARILAKTGTRRQGDLLALVHRVAVPAGPVEGDAVATGRQPR